VIGVPNMGPVTLVDQLEADLPELSWEVSLDRLLSSSPEMARARMEVQRAECELARECAGRVPNVNVEAGLQYNHASEDTVASVTLAMPLQLFDRNQGNIRRAECELAAARQEVRRLELSLQDRLADSFRKYATAQQQACRYRDDILPDAKDSLDLVREGYRQGEFGYLELLTSQRTYFHVNLAYVESLHALCIGNMRIEGMLLCGALMPPGP
jgi:cobalt-zinc-cadmium efflux system outer membrane protein